MLLYNENPYVIEFLTMIYTRPDSLEVSEKVKEVYNEIFVLRNESLIIMQDEKNDSPFRKDIEPEVIKKYIIWLIEGYSQELIAQMDIEKKITDRFLIGEYELEFNKIMNDLKTIFYK